MAAPLGAPLNGGGNLSCKGEDGFRLFRRLPEVLLADESAVGAVVLVVMTRLNVAYTLPAALVLVSSLVVHVCRRQHHHRQIYSQQCDRCNMSQRVQFHLFQRYVKPYLFDNQCYIFYRFFSSQSPCIPLVFT